MDLAREAQRNGRWSEALDAWRDVVEASPDPERSGASLALAHCLERLQRLAEAEAVYRRLSETSPRDVRALRGLARVSQRRGDWETALKGWQALATISPDDLQAALATARCLERLQQPDEAEAIYRRVAETRPQETRAHHALARIAQGRGAWEAALTHWKAVATANPDDVEAALKVAHCLSRLRHLDEAEIAYRRIIGVSPGERRAHRGLARVSQLRGDWETALRRYRAAMSAFPDDAEAALLTARCLIRLERYSDAEDVYRKVAEMWPQEEARANRGLALVSQLRGDWEAALGQWQAAPGAAHDLSGALGIGGSLEGLQRLDEAAAVYANAIERFPGEPRALFALAATRIKAGRLKDPEVSRRFSHHLAAFKSSPEQRHRNIAAFIESVVDAEIRRPVVDDPNAEVLVGGAGSGGTVVLVFTGLQGGWPFPIALFDAYMAARGISVVYLRDFSRSIFCGGVNSLSKSFKGTLSALRRLYRQLGGERLYTVGTSAGGYAAIRYGVELCADGVLGFGAPTVLLADFLAAHGDVRGRLVWKRINRQFPPDALDLRPLIQSARRVPRIDLFFGADMREDSLHAHYLVGQPSVHLHPIQDCRAHACLLDLVEGGRFSRIFDTLIDQRMAADA